MLDTSYSGCSQGLLVLNEFFFWTESGRDSMADSTFGTIRSLLVDSSIFDSRMAETSKDHTFLCLTSEDAEGKQQGPLLPAVNSFDKLSYLLACCHFFQILQQGLDVFCFFFFPPSSFCMFSVTAFVFPMRLTLPLGF